MDWILLLNWTVQGLILAGFAFVGVYVGLRLFTRGRSGPPLAEAPGSEKSQRPATPSGVVATAAAPLPEVAPSRRVLAGPESVRHAFEIEGDRVTVMVELPLALLHDDRTVVDAWMEAIGAARLGDTPVTAQGPIPVGAASDEQEQLQVRLNEVLNRLQLAAERRRRLRAMLEERFPLDES
ncbi:MAG: hypothetical protein RMN24_07895 [Anaerolineae bacterium]|nr:hypothetical protein [Caldilineales bacterium]MCX7851929.1 hypothetical protein [Caldilineales bacterium]MDW8269070.1 hypothetical protein [Anaerolineae bacterium]